MLFAGAVKAAPAEFQNDQKIVLFFQGSNQSPRLLKLDNRQNQLTPVTFADVRSRSLLRGSRNIYG
jgi:hypothetical protein